MNSPATQLVIGLPMSGRGLAPTWALSMLNQDFPVSMLADYHAVVGKTVTEARNIIAEDAIESKVPYLWFVDDDTAPPPLALRNLMYTLKQYEDDSVMAVGGIYCTKTSLPEPLIFKKQGQGAFWKWKVGDIFDVDGMGLGCLLVNTKVFSRLEKPWFRDTDTPIDTNGNMQQSEDLYFCQQVIDSGFRILAHGSVLCTHWREVDGTFRSYTLPITSYPYRKELT